MQTGGWRGLGRGADGRLEALRNMRPAGKTEPWTAYVLAWCDAGRRRQRRPQQRRLFPCRRLALVGCRSRRG